MPDEVTELGDWSELNSPPYWSRGFMQLTHSEPRAIRQLNPPLFECVRVWIEGKHANSSASLAPQRLLFFSRFQVSTPNLPFWPIPIYYPQSHNFINCGCHCTVKSHTGIRLLHLQLTKHLPTHCLRIYGLVVWTKLACCRSGYFQEQFHFIILHSHTGTYFHNRSLNF